MIVIVDYRMGNPGSIANMCRRLGIAATISGDLAVIAAAERLILPGVGHFAHCVASIDALGLRPVLAHKAQVERRPILGICMGMQVMTRRSDEGAGDGLGWVDGEVRPFTFPLDPMSETPKIPHIGWAYVAPATPHPLLDGLGDAPRFYFVHSFHVECRRPEDILLHSAYGGRVFTSAIARGNIAGVQFHPEKSHNFGMILLRNFAGWDGGDARAP
jgi:glutamine amidotransferase